jgi:hypothetical protein
VDPRPEAIEGGEIKIRITPQLVHDIFDEYPVVAKAYSDNVPEKVCFQNAISTLREPIVYFFSLQKKGFGEDTFNPSCLMHTELLSDHQLRRLS